MIESETGTIDGVSRTIDCVFCFTEYETGTIDGVDDDDSAFVDNPRDKDVSIPLKAVKTEGGAISNEGPLVIRG